MSNADPRLLEGEMPFTTGRARFYDHERPGEQDPRIYIEVDFGLGGTFLAMLDTGAPWCIVRSDLANEIGLTIDPAGDFVNLSIRGNLRRGQLQKHPITILADEGESLEVNGTFYVIDDHWAGPNFIGYGGLLQWTRFAVDPTRNLFYFGSAQVGAGTAYS